MAGIIISSIILVIAISAAVYVFVTDCPELGIMFVGVVCLFAVVLGSEIDEHINGETCGPDSTIVKVMNNDPSIQIDTIALDKDGKIREVKIKQLK